MNTLKSLGCALVVGGLVAMVMCISGQNEFRKKFMAARIDTLDDFVHLLPHSPEDIIKRTAQYQNMLAQEVEYIVTIAPDKRLFDNTVRAFDRAAGYSDAVIWTRILSLWENTHPDAAMRDTAREALAQMQAFFVDQFTSNKAMFTALFDYDREKDLREYLTRVQKYALQEMIDEYLRSGIRLPDEQFKRMTELRKQIDELCLTFGRNIAASNQQLEVTEQDLAGISAEWIQGRERTPKGTYLLGTDYPTYNMIMANCTVQKTREGLYLLFQNRGYPANENILKQIIQKRNELAQLLGFATYAHLDLDSQMVRTPERAEQFLTDLVEKSAPKEQEELAKFSADLPEGVTLTADGKIKPWDIEYMKNSYKKKHLAIDEVAIASYFPMDHTIEQLLDIYRIFMSLEFEQVACPGLWHPDVRTLKVSNQDKSRVYGYLFLDLYPRPNKFTHAAEFGLVPAIWCQEMLGYLPAFAAVVANFERPTADRPSLLTRSDVRTFFHEFGHALHELLGSTELATQAGTNVKRDFVELPSQMLEEWLWDAAILKKVSSHYQTGEPLPDELIQKILDSRQFDIGYWVQRQLLLARYSLELYKHVRDPQELWRELDEKYRAAFMYEPRAHFFASFGHLTDYGAKYYGYLWSQVFALDLFDEIKKHGLLDPVIGQKYVDEVIGKGGSQDPNELLENFLGRTPDQRAFLASLGL